MPHVSSYTEAPSALNFLIFHDTGTEQNGPVLLCASVVYRVHAQVPNQRPRGRKKRYIDVRVRVNETEDMLDV